MWPLQFTAAALLQPPQPPLSSSLQAMPFPPLNSALSRCQNPQSIEATGLQHNLIGPSSQATITYSHLQKHSTLHSLEMTESQPNTSGFCRHRAPYHTSHTPDFELCNPHLPLTTPHPTTEYTECGALSSPALTEFHSLLKPGLNNWSGMAPAVSHSPQHRQ